MFFFFLAESFQLQFTHRSHELIMVSNTKTPLQIKKHGKQNHIAELYAIHPKMPISYGFTSVYYMCVMLKMKKMHNIHIQRDRNLPVLYI